MRLTNTANMFYMHMYVLCTHQMHTRATTIIFHTSFLSFSLSLTQTRAHAHTHARTHTHTHTHTDVDTWHNRTLQPHNAIPIQPFFGGPHDACLEGLLPLLEKLSTVPDVRPILGACHRTGNFCSGVGESMSTRRPLRHHRLRSSGSKKQGVEMGGREAADAVTTSSGRASPEGEAALCLSIAESCAEKSRNCEWMVFGHTGQRLESEGCTEAGAILGVCAADTLADFCENCPASRGCRAAWQSPMLLNSQGL